MAEIDPITPSQIFEAIRHAKTENPKDVYGDGAFKINTNNIRPGNKGVRYMDFDIKRKKGNKWEWAPLHLRFMNLTTKSSIPKPRDPKRKKDNVFINGVQIQFRRSSSFMGKTRDASGKEVSIEEKYGEAKIAIYAAFGRLVRSALKSKDLHNSTTKVVYTVQFDRLIDKNTRKTEKLSDAIIRVEIPFQKEDDGQTIKDDAKPRCEIYDLTKKLSRDDPRVKQNGGFQYEIATLTSKDGKEKIEITYENIGEFITAGSSVSGIDSMSSVCLSNMGISLPSKTSLLIVKPSKGFKPDPSKIFKMDEFDTMENAEVHPEEGGNNELGNNELGNNESGNKDEIENDTNPTINTSREFIEDLSASTQIEFTDNIDDAFEDDPINFQ